MMDRRTFNKFVSLAALGALAENVEMSTAQAAAVAGEVVLEDRDLVVAFDPVTGALSRFERKSSGWPIERRPALGASFRLFVPLSDRTANFVFGSKQRAAGVEKISVNQVRIEWTNLTSERSGVLPITFTATVTLKKGELTFEGTVNNQSDLSVETVDYPYFGDLNPPTPGIPLRAEYMFTGALQQKEIHPHFANEMGYWGVKYPTKIINQQQYQCQFCLISAPEQGVYVGAHDPAIRYLVQFVFEQQPGVIDPTDAGVPRGDEMQGVPIHLEFTARHFTFAHPNTTVELVPIVLRTYSGDWHAALDIYAQWRATWFEKPHIAGWAQNVHSWQQLRIDGAEQDFLVPYRHLPTYIDGCAANGVTAIQLVGWNHGGQDGGDPSLDTDPGLGTWEELHQAILHAKSKGVKMILFGKPYFADMSTEFYQKELYKYQSTDPYGFKYESGSYSYTTPTQEAGINNRRRAIMDVCSKEYRDIATREFEKTVALGAAGWLFDEVMQHNGAVYNFSPDHGYTPPGFLYGADIPLVKQFRAVADKVDPDFLFSGEGPNDWLMPFYPLGYYRIGPDTIHILRYIDPRAPLMAAVTGFNDRGTINLMLAYRYIISYEPYNFKGHVTDFPLTLEYGKKIDALRKRYKNWIWDADFRDTLGARVTADGEFRYTVFRNADQKRAVVVVNLETTRSIKVELEIPEPDQLVSVTPEDPEPKTTSGSLEIPARSAIVVMEQ
jgi:hypothetical protein